MHARDACHKQHAFSAQPLVVPAKISIGPAGPVPTWLLRVQGDELTVRFMLEEGKLNLCLRSMAQFCQTIHSKVH